MPWGTRECALGSVFRESSWRRSLKPFFPLKERRVFGVKSRLRRVTRHTGQGNMEMRISALLYCVWRGWGEVGRGYREEERG